MEEEKFKVVFLPEASAAIEEVALYVEQKGYTETSEHYTERMVDFGFSLALFPEKYPLCRFKKFARKNLRCATFEQTYIFIYKIIHKQVIIYNVIHGKAMK